MTGPAVKRYTKSCDECGSFFRANHRRRRWCGRSCYAKHSRRKLGRLAAEPMPTTCATCGVMFVPYRNDSNVRFCSKRCNWDVNNRRRRARRAQVKSEPYTLLEIADRDGWSCHICGEVVDQSLLGQFEYDAGRPSVDHLIPLSRGGDDTRSNVALAHNGCNLSKGASLAWSTS